MGKIKKIMLLGGSAQQIPAIKYAGEKGYYTVLCDYLKDNPGREYADKFYCESTTDRERILSTAKKENVDGIVAYASDPAAPTAAYVAEKLNLPTSPYSSIEILAYKDKFRKFLTENGFNCPKAGKFDSYEEAEAEIESFIFPLMVKPVDSSGSKGVSRIESPGQFFRAYQQALEKSRAKSVLVEEFIVRNHPYMVAGDCFAVDGRVAFWGFLNSHRNKDANPFVPVGTSYPIDIDNKRIKIIKKEIQRMFDLLSIKSGAFNMEIVFDGDDNLYFIEMGPRNGGNMIPELLYMATGEDLIAATVESAMGNRYDFKENTGREKYLAAYVLHSCKHGIFKGVEHEKSIKDFVLRQVLYKKPGDEISYFDGSDKAVGIVFFEFNSKNKMLEVLDNPDKWIRIITE